jgi:hypothetical protein
MASATDSDSSNVPASPTAVSIKFGMRRNFLELFFWP